MIKFEAKFREAVSKGDDAAHDVLHFVRVVKTAKHLCKIEGACEEVVIPAAWLHDFVQVAKDDPRRSQASKLSAQAAVNFLSTIGYPKEFFSDIAHAIEAHSFSANIKPETLEAKIVQDADRLDALGAIGIARCLLVSGKLGRPLYSELDAFCETRIPDDSKFTVDHFYVKLFQIANTLHTESAKREGAKRVGEMKVFLKALGEEI